MNSPRDVDATLAEQIAYYDERAAEYDEWAYRRGRYDHGAEANARWFVETAIVRQALQAASLTGDVLELAAGTGIWTEQLARTTDRVTAVDASPAMTAVNRERLRLEDLQSNVTYIQADLLAWEPPRRFDAVFVGFFLSHVPDDRLDGLLATISRALAPGGRLFFVDSRREPTASSPDQPLAASGDDVMTRRLNDGRTYRIFKLFRSAEEYHDAFARHGIVMEVEETPTYFQYGVGVKER